MIFTYEPLINRQRTVTGGRLLAHGRQASLEELANVWPRRNTILFAPDHLPSAEDLTSWQLPDNAILELSTQALAGRQGCLSELERMQQPLALSGIKAGMSPQGNFRFLLADPSFPATSLPGLPLAEGLADAPAFDACLENGFAGASGWFFLKGSKPTGRLSPSHAHIVRLLGQVRAGADLKDVEDGLKQDLALSYRLLRYINLVGFGLSCEIQSFRHAVAIMGYEKLNRWLCLLLVTASQDAMAPALVQAAITRGRFMELAAKSFFDQNELDNLFITGAFSLLDLLLGTPMVDILEQMRLPHAIGDALLQGQGPYAPLLDLARACEGTSAEGLLRQTKALGLNPGTVNRALLSALGFTEDMLAS